MNPYPGLENERVLVTGASGYIGKRLIRRLQSLGVTVFGTDVRNGPHCHFVGSVCDANFVRECVFFSRASRVIHLASYGMSGREMSDEARVWQVNVDGTRHLCEACCDTNAHLIYVSTVNVCFDGQEKKSAPEDDPRLSSSRTSGEDAYSLSKRAAEETCEEFARARNLRWVSLRPYGIYGEGEERHFPRTLSWLKWGLHARLGHPNDASDWIHADNLVHALLLAAQKISHLPNGSCYFVGDNVPCNTIAMLDPLWKKVAGKFSYSSPWIPFRVVYGAAGLAEDVCRVMTRVSGTVWTPPLSRAEVKKVARTHWWRWDRVKKELGYEPIVTREEGLERMYQYFNAMLEREGYPEKFYASVTKALFALLFVFVVIISYAFKH